MRRKSGYVLAAMLLALGLAACKHDPGIIKYPSPMGNLKQAPHDTTQEDKQSAAQIHIHGAVWYSVQEHLKEAETALNKAVGFDDKYVPAHTLLAILYWRINRMPEADQEFRTAISLDPSNGDTNNNYGKFLCERGNRQDAMKYFQRALAA